MGGDGGRGWLQLLTSVASPPVRPHLPLLVMPQTSPEKEAVVAEGSAQFNTQNKLIHSRGRQ